LVPRVGRPKGTPQGPETTRCCGKGKWIGKKGGLRGYLKSAVQKTPTKGPLHPDLKVKGGGSETTKKLSKQKPKSPTWGGVHSFELSKSRSNRQASKGRYSGQSQR